VYTEDDLLSLSALQHLVFCERQFALIHVEQGWRENLFTAQGRVLHERVHTRGAERRPGVRTEFGMPIRSMSLGVSGIADVVEVRSGGVLYPIEYKRGRRKARSMDEVQLCAQALCLEEMLGTTITEGALFYGKERRRKVVAFDDELRALTERAAGRAHEIIEKGLTPAPAYTKQCRSCSFYESCMPRLLSRRHDIEGYIRRMAGLPINVSEEEE
jgi:CRISPR-associated exonuclease Cas4